MESYERRKLLYRIVRKMAITKLGGKCIRCGFSDHRALQIDHVNGGGLTELRATAWRQYILAVLADTEGKYQCLCANCNWIKRNENDENPNSREGSISAEDLASFLKQENCFS